MDLIKIAELVYQNKSLKSYSVTSDYLEFLNLKYGGNGWSANEEIIEKEVECFCLNDIDVEGDFYYEDEYHGHSFYYLKGEFIGYQERESYLIYISKEMKIKFTNYIFSHLMINDDDIYNEESGDYYSIRYANNLYDYTINLEGVNTPVLFNGFSYFEDVDGWTGKVDKTHCNIKMNDDFYSIPINELKKALKTKI